MNHYRGLQGDPIRGGGKWVEDHGTGHEVFNFASHRGRCYGFVRPSAGSLIDIDRLGAAPGSPMLDGVLVAWVAKQPGGGLRVVGWYEDARVFRDRQASPPGADRAVTGKRDQAGSNVVANASNTRCLDPEERTFPIPRNKKGAMGQANVWFADSKLGAKVAASFRTYLDKVKKDRRKRATGGADKGVARAVDQLKKRRVELAAIRLVWTKYEELGFDVRDVQGDNVGWDLVARRAGGTKLLLEVKGLSGAGQVVELTANEFTQMNRRTNRKDYRLCVVTNALADRKRTLRRFFYNPELKVWCSEDDGSTLEITPMTSARVTIT